MRILYIDIDCLRPDHMGCHGYCRDTTPVLDAVAARGMRFDRCYTTDAPCLPSRAALFSGRPGIQNGVVAHEGSGASFRYPGDGHTTDPARRMWMDALLRQGYRTVSFSSFAHRHLAWWFTAGFAEYYGQQLLSGGHETADEVNSLVLPWLRSNACEDNWFLHVHYWDVHTPYRAPQQFWDMVQEQPEPAWPDAATIEQHGQQWYGPRTPRHFFGGCRSGKSPFPTMPDNCADREQYMQLCNGYDAGIRYVDTAVSQLLEVLDAADVREETAIIISGDHGEAIGEQGMYFEHGNASDGIARIPLIIDWPGLPAGQVCSEFVNNIDLPVTVLNLLEMETPAAWEGQSLTPALHGHDFAGRDHVIWGCGIYAFQRAVRTRDWLFIRTLHSGVFPHEPMYLFDMSTDPWQQHNLVMQESERTAEMDHLLSNWWYHHCTGPEAVMDPFLPMMTREGPDLYCSVERTQWMLERTERTAEQQDLQRRRGVVPWRFRPGSQ